MLAVQHLFLRIHLNIFQDIIPKKIKAAIIFQTGMFSSVPRLGESLTFFNSTSFARMKFITPNSPSLAITSMTSLRALSNFTTSETFKCDCAKISLTFNFSLSKAPAGTGSLLNSLELMNSSKVSIALSSIEIPLAFNSVNCSLL